MPGQTWLAMGAGKHREAIGWQESNRSQGAKAFLPPQMAEHGARAIESEYRMCLIQTDPILCFRFGAPAGGRGRQGGGPVERTTNRLTYKQTNKQRNIQEEVLVRPGDRRGVKPGVRPGDRRGTGSPPG